MKKIYTLLFITLIVTALSPGILLSQQVFSISGIDPSGFPRVVASFVAQDYAGKPYTNLTINDFNVLENGVSMNSSLELDCKDTIINPAVSIILVLDQSSSMKETNDSGQTRWSWVLEGATSFIKTIDYKSGTKVALITFGNVSYIRYPFTNNKDSLIDSLKKIMVSGGTLYEPPFLDHRTGAVNYFKTYSPDVNKRRIIVFLTDGEPYTYPVVDSILTNKFDNGLLQNNIQVYAITVGMKMHPSLTKICSSTGGQAYAVYTKRELNDIYTYIALDIQRTQFCKLSWKPPYGCDETSRKREVKITFKRQGETVEKIYYAPETSIQKVETSESIVAFGDPAVGTPVTKDITYTPRMSDFKVDTMYTQPSTYFSIVNWDVGKTNATTPSFPFVIQKDSSRTIRVQFVNQAPKSYRLSTVVSSGLYCPPFVTLVGGISKIQIIEPNGGELYSTCETVTIKWGGVEADKPINLSYSEDGGNTWTVLATNVTGLSYRWNPPRAGKNYLIRGSVSAVKSYMWLKGAGGSGDDVSNSIAIMDNNLYFYITGYYEGSAKFEDKTITSRGNKDIFLAKYDSDGKLIWVVSAGGPGNDTATGIVSDAKGNVYLTGTCYQGAQFGNQLPNMDVSDAPYCFVAKYDANGNFSAVTTMIGPTNTWNKFKAWGLKIKYIKNNPDPDKQDKNNPDEVHVQGMYTGQIQSPFGWQLPSKTQPTSFTATFFTDLSIRSVVQGKPNDVDYSSDMVYDTDGNKYETGFYSNSLTAGTTTITSAGKKDIFIRKYGGSPGSTDTSDKVFSVESPRLAFVRNSVDFGRVYIPEFYDSTFSSILCNVGTLPVFIDSIKFNGTHPTDFILGAALVGLRLLPGDCVPVEIVFSPGNIGPRQAQLIVYGSCSNPVILDIKGFGVCKGISLPLVEFGTINVNFKKDSTIKCIYKNTTKTYLPVKIIISGDNASDFSCATEEVILDPDGCLDLKISFTPSMPGLRKARVTYQLPNGCEDQITELNGYGLDADITVTGIDWKERRVLTVNDSAIVINNNSVLPQRITKVVLEDPVNGEFVLGNINLPITMAAGGTESLPVTFIPQGENTFTNTILVSIESLSNPLRTPIRGVGILPKISTNWVCDTSAKPGDQSVARLEVTNPSTSADLFIYNMAFEYNRGEFNWPGVPPTNVTISKGATETFNIIFKPQSTGIISDIINITSDAGPGPDKQPQVLTKVDALCDGLGIQTVKDFDFSGVLICDTLHRNIRISNQSWQTPITVTEYFLTGADIDAFEVDFPADFTISSGNYRDLKLIFKPTEDKTYSATLHLKTSINLELQVPLKGKGEMIHLYLESDKIAGRPADYKFIKIKAKVNQLAKPIITNMAIQVKFDNNMVLYHKIEIPDKFKTFWDNGTILKKGLLEVKGTNGTLSAPFDEVMFTFVCQLYLGATKESQMFLKPIIEPCVTKDTLGANVTLSDVCFLGGRLIKVTNTPFALQVPEPNPTNNEATIYYSVGFDGSTTIELYNSMGQLVKTLVDENLTAGNYKYILPVSDLRSGVYLINMKSSNYFESRNLIIYK